MIAKICPRCGFKNFTDNPRCSRCSELLLSAGPSGPARSTPPPPPPIEEEETCTPITYVGTTPSAPVPIPGPATTTSPVPYSPPPAPTVHGGTSPIPISVHPPCPLPAHLRYLGTPIVEGEVIDSGQILNEDKSLKTGDVLHYGLSTVLLVTRPLYGLMSFASGARKPKEHKNVLTYRVRTPGGDLVEVRIEKDIMGASISMGDYITVWGREVGGVIIVRNAYNHTVRGEVRVK